MMQNYYQALINYSLFNEYQKFLYFRDNNQLPFVNANFKCDVPNNHHPIYDFSSMITPLFAYHPNVNNLGNPNFQNNK
jgi:hypothetical protein